MRDSGPLDLSMSLIDATVAVSQTVALAVCAFLLVKFTSLPFWAVFLISIPLGGVIGTIAGIGLGIAIGSAFQKWKKTP